ncbi:MAG TPA: IS4 family transposase [Candidatus Binatia bacterium]|nr:IS4 family transposase [Candidatus Binatia bacterium]
MKEKSKRSDFFTPFFLPWRARLSAGRRALPGADCGRPILHQLQGLFGRWLPAHTLCPTKTGPCSRQRRWPLGLTFWTFLAQVLSPGSSCRAAVRQAQAQARLENWPVPDDDDSAYCQARSRLALERLQEAIKRVGRGMEQGVGAAQRWCGHVVQVLDATTLTADDTLANQKEFPQHPDQAPGCGFPLLRLVGWFCLASGALLGWNSGDYWQSERALAATLWELLQPWEVLLADRYYGCYRVLALVQARGAHAVCRLHASRGADFRRGQRLGPMDRLITWSRPKEVPAGLSLEQWLAFPATLTVRLVRVRVEEKGFRTRTVTLVTTLLDDQKYPPSALAALYRRRWQVELTFRQIKIALGMEHLAVRSPAMIQRALAMHLLAYQLIRALMQEAAQTWDVPLERISFQGAVDATRHFGEALLRARTKRGRTALVAELLRVLAADAVPERPGRCEPRLLKRRPKRFGRMAYSRWRYRRQLLRGRSIPNCKKSRA